jgi:hypothetical protein
MKLIITLILLFAATTSSADPFSDGDPKIGKQLLGLLNCNNCHIKMAGGDGSGIYTRSDSKVHNVAELFAQFEVCSGGATLLTPEDKQHLGAYLNRYYNLK